MSGTEVEEVLARFTGKAQRTNGSEYEALCTTWNDTAPSKSALSEFAANLSPVDDPLAMAIALYGLDSFVTATATLCGAALCKPIES